MGIFAYFIGSVFVWGSNPQLSDIQVIPIEKVERRIDATVYAYTNLPELTDSTPDYTASGVHVREGIVANNCLDFGELVLIEGKIYEVQDRMSKRYNCSYFDVFLPTLVGAQSWGKKRIEVIILPSSVAFNTSNET